jgi:Family of unknown function (DUF6511)
VRSLALCFCGREARGFYYQRPVAPPRVPPKESGSFVEPRAAPPKVRCCSMARLDVAHKMRGTMPNLTKWEAAAIEAASDPAGEYIEATGTTDMATWSAETWFGFLECVIAAYARRMRELAESGEAPF